MSLGDGKRTRKYRTATADTSQSIYYAWDAPNHLASADVAAGTITFTYNADGQRVAKQATDGSTTAFLYDHKKLLQETDDVGGEITKHCRFTEYQANSDRKENVNQ